MRSKPVYPEHLTQEEINQVRDVSLESKYLERIRDIFLFACYTGLSKVATNEVQPDGQIEIPCDEEKIYRRSVWKNFRALAAKKPRCFTGWALKN
jgi:hypothetical protein